MIKINSLEIENVKRIKAVQLTPSERGLTIIGGRNGQGKTSVLDAIAWALGGDRFRPSDAAREGSCIPPVLRVTLSGGIVAERRGKNSALTVTDPSGRRAGQQLLNEFIEALALDLPRFMEASGREKAETLLRIIGVEDQLAGLDRQEQQLYQERLAVGRIADQKRKFAAELPDYPDAPDEPVSASELIRRQQDILARNGENSRKRAHLALLEAEAETLRGQIDVLRQKLRDLTSRQETVLADLELARRDAMQLQDESTAELEESIRNVERINVMVRANLDKERAEEEAADYGRRYDALTDELAAVRSRRRKLLEDAEMPLPELTVEGGELLYRGRKWDCMSGAEQLKVSTAIVRRLNPQCGFVLMDRLEQMDPDTLREFGDWLEQEGLQVIGTRVSTGSECSIIIEDGQAMAPAQTALYDAPPAQEAAQTAPHIAPPAQTTSQAATPTDRFAPTADGTAVSRRDNPAAVSRWRKGEF